MNTEIFISKEIWDFKKTQHVWASRMPHPPPLRYDMKSFSPPPAHRTKTRDHLHQLNPHKNESAMCYFHATFWKWELCCIISTNNRWNSRAAVKEQSWITHTSLLPSICFYDNRPDLHTKMCRYIKGSQRSIFTYILGWISLTRRGSEQTRHVYLK